MEMTSKIISANAGDALSSAFAVCVNGPAWLSFIVGILHTLMEYGSSLFFGGIPAPSDLTRLL